MIEGGKGGGTEGRRWDGNCAHLVLTCLEPGEGFDHHLASISLARAPSFFYSNHTPMAILYMLFSCLITLRIISFFMFDPSSPLLRFSSTCP